MPIRRSAGQRCERWPTGRPASADWTPRTFLLLGTFILASLGATALLVAFMLEGTAFARASSGVDGEAVARRFYTAINDAVRTGDLSHLMNVRNMVHRYASMLEDSGYED